MTTKTVKKTVFLAHAKSATDDDIAEMKEVTARLVALLPTREGLPCEPIVTAARDAWGLFERRFYPGPVDWAQWGPHILEEHPATGKPNYDVLVVPGFSVLQGTAPIVDGALKRTRPVFVLDYGPQLGEDDIVEDPHLVKITQIMPPRQGEKGPKRVWTLS